MKLKTHRLCENHLNRLYHNNSKQEYSLNRSFDSSQIDPQTTGTLLDSTLSISSFAYHSLHHNKTKFSKKKRLSRSLNKDNEGQKGRTPFQNRKISQKQKTSKVLDNILANSRKKRDIEESQKEWMKVYEVSPEKPLRKQQEKDDQHIRQTGISLQQLCQEPLQRYAQNQSELFDSSTMLDSPLVPNSFQHSLTNRSKKKMAFKLLWKQKSQALKPDPKGTVARERSQIIHTNTKQHLNSLPLRKGGKLNKCQTQASEDIKNQQRSSFNMKRPTKSSRESNLLFHDTGSAFKIQPCCFQNNTAKNQSCCCRFSEQKIKKAKDLRMKICQYRSTKYIKTQKTEEENFAKQFTAWEIYNDFSERETLT